MATDDWKAFIESVDEVKPAGDVVGKAVEIFLDSGCAQPLQAERLPEPAVAALAKRALRELEALQVAKRQ